MINKTYKESLNIEYTTPKIARGYVGAVAYDLDIPQSYLLVKSKLYSHLYIIYTLIDTNAMSYIYYTHLYNYTLTTTYHIHMIHSYIIGKETPKVESIKLTLPAVPEEEPPTEPPTINSDAMATETPNPILQV